MERQSYYQSDDASKGNKEGSSSKPAGFNFAPIPITPAFERPERPAPAHRPVEVPLEGVINWRRNVEDQPDIRDRADRADFEKPKEADSRHEKDDSDDEDEDSTTSKKQTAQQPQPVRPQPVQEAPASPRPIDEVLAELRAKQAEQTEGQPVEAQHAEGELPLPQAHVAEQQAPADQQEEVPAPPIVPLDRFPALSGLRAEQPFGVPAAEQIDDEDEAMPLPPAPMQPQAAAVPGPGVQPAGANPNAMPNMPGNMVGNVAPLQFGVAPNVNPNVAAANNAANLPPTPPGGPGGPNAGGFNTPPPNQPGNFNQFNAYNPNNPMYANMMGGGYNASPNVSPNAAPAMPIERPGIPTSNRDPRVAPVAALLGLEYFARKRADRKLERRVNERADDRQAKMQERIATDNRIMQERQRQFATEQQRQADEMQQMRYSQEASAPAERPFAGGLPRPFESAPSGAEQFAPRPQAAEARPMSPQEQARVAAARPEQPQNVEATEDLKFDLQPDHRVEHSSWHNIVVDEHGHEVAGAMQYGEGFQRERQQEIVRDRVADSNGMSGAGGMITSGTPQQDQFGNPIHTGSLPSGMVNPALPQGQPTHVDPSHQLEALNKQASNLTNPWFWIMLLLIVAAFFTAALV